MRRGCTLTALWCGLAAAADPVRTAWIMSPAAIARAPEIHSVAVDERYATVRSAGISLRYFGILQQAPVSGEAPREFEFRIPLHPEPGRGRHARVPVGMIGTFVNGLPIYNQLEALSWNGANLWHYDAVAQNDDGRLTATGHPRAELTHPAAAGLLEELVRNGSRHSPLIGFALDGYPVYGPWASANPDGTGGLRRMRSSYRLRAIAQRRTWPDGTRLTPGQFGPDVSASDPPGTFAEDYEYAPGSGDLDEFNGRFAATPEYPGGTYAYFLTTGDDGRLAFPYLIGPRFLGRVDASAERRYFPIAAGRVELAADRERIEAGRAVRLRLTARAPSGEHIRHFEFVHERPIHLIVVSEDLAEFAHIHPELAADDSYEVTHTFAHGGKYRIWADYSLPGEAPRVDAFDIAVEGERRAPQTISAPATGAFTVRLTAEKPLRAGEDVPLTLRLDGPIDSLEPYLGAWAHVIVSSEDLASFAHAHPVEGVDAVHTHAAAGPPPREIHVVTSFASAGLYKLWAQFQSGGTVITAPFLLRVDAGQPAGTGGATPEGIPVRVTSHGFEPASVEIPAGTAVTLAFTRDSTPNCGTEVLFPALQIRKALRLGETVLVKLPAQPAGEIRFSCGMGMYRGMIIAR